MPDEPALARQLILIRTLIARRFGATVRELAREMEVTEKTIRRDLSRFRRLGFPLVEETGERGRKAWRLLHDAKLPPLVFSYDEALVLYLARPFLAPLAGTNLWTSAHNALAKIRATLSEHSLAYLEQFPNFFHSTTNGFGDYSSKTDVIDELTVAIEDRKAVHITYQSARATEPATRDVYPYSLVRHKGSLYLVAFAPEYDQIRHYKIDRVSTIETSPIVFQRPADFNIAAYLSGSFGIYDGDENVTVVVKFRPAVVRYVEESRWHPSQVLTRERDGGLLARFQLSSTVEIKAWLLSFGANAVVIEPDELRMAMKRDLEDMILAYAEESMSGANPPIR